MQVETKQTPCSLRWHYPEQVPRVDELNTRAHPLSRNFGSPHGPQAGCVECYAPSDVLSTLRCALLLKEDKLVEIVNLSFR